MYVFIDNSCRIEYKRYEQQLSSSKPSKDEKLYSTTATQTDVTVNPS